MHSKGNPEATLLGSQKTCLMSPCHGCARTKHANQINRIVKTLVLHRVLKFVDAFIDRFAVERRSRMMRKVESFFSTVPREETCKTGKGGIYIKQTSPEKLLMLKLVRRYCGENDLRVNSCENQEWWAPCIQDRNRSKNHAKEKWLPSNQDDCSEL